MSALEQENLRPVAVSNDATKHGAGGGAAKAVSPKKRPRGLTARATVNTDATAIVTPVAAAVRDPYHPRAAQNYYTTACDARLSDNDDDEEEGGLVAALESQLLLADGGDVPGDFLPAQGFEEEEGDAFKLRASLNYIQRDFRLTARLAANDDAVVFRGVDKRTGGDVAIKVGPDRCHLILGFCLCF